MILSIDFDHVIHDKAHPIPGKRMGAPMAGAKEGLEFYKSRGDIIIVFCLWAGTEQGQTTIEKFMEYYQLPYDYITNVKQQSDYFIDDRGVHFTSWEELRKIV